MSNEIPPAAWEITKILTDPEVSEAVKNELRANLGMPLTSTYNSARGLFQVRPHVYAERHEDPALVYYRKPKEN